LPPIKKYYRSDFDYQQKQEVDQLAGGFLMTKKEIINKIGGFDERFFLWFEDVDFCYRLKTAGWKIIYNPEIKIKHYGHQSFDQMMPYRKQKIYNQSLMNYFIKYSPRWQFFILLALRPISLCLSFVVQISRPLFKGFYASRQLSKRC
jgi:GT2 family glycosyltransferase